MQWGTLTLIIAVLTLSLSLFHPHCSTCPSHFRIFSWIFYQIFKKYRTNSVEKNFFLPFLLW